MELPGSIKCPDHCHYFLKFVEACPFYTLDPLESFAEHIWQIYMVFATCIPHSLIVVLGLHWIFSKFAYVPFGLFASVFTDTTGKILKNILKMPRPNAECCKSYGMPSGHATLATFFLVWFLANLLRSPEKSKLRAFLVFLYGIHVPIILYSRFYLMYHYPIQIIAGIVYGFTMAVAWQYFSTKKDANKKFEMNLMKLRGA